MTQWSHILLGVFWMALVGCVPPSGGNGGSPDDSAVFGDGGHSARGVTDVLPESGMVSLDARTGEARGLDGGPLDASVPGGPLLDGGMLDGFGLSPRDLGLARDRGFSMADARMDGSLAVDDGGGRIPDVGPLLDAAREPDAAPPRSLADCPPAALAARCAAACEATMNCTLGDECPGFDRDLRTAYHTRCLAACEANPAASDRLCAAPRCGGLFLEADALMDGFVDECLHGPRLGECMDLALCAFDCRRDERCVSACAGRGVEAAQALFEPLWDCIRPRGCVPENGLPDSDCVNRICRQEWAECFAPLAPEAPGCIMALNCSARCEDLDCLEDCLDAVTAEGRAAFLAVNACAGEHQCQDIACVVINCSAEMRSCQETDPGERGCDAIHTCFWGGVNHPLSEYCPIHGRPEAQEAFYRYLGCVQRSGCAGRAACDRACLESFALCWGIR